MSAWIEFTAKDMDVSRLREKVASGDRVIENELYYTLGDAFPDFPFTWKYFDVSENGFVMQIGVCRVRTNDGELKDVVVYVLKWIMERVVMGCDSAITIEYSF